MLSCEEEARRLKAALALKLAESYKRELLRLLETGAIPAFSEAAGTVNSFLELSDFMDAEMIPPGDERWLLGRPLVKDNCWIPDEDGQRLAEEVITMAQVSVTKWLREGGLETSAV